MKICLVPFPVWWDSPETVDQKQLCPYVPLGVLTLGTLLEQEGHKVTILDLVWGTDSGSLETQTLPKPEDVARLIQNKTSDIVGFSTIFSSYPLVIKWAESFHQLSPQTPILFGGPHATVCAEQTLQAFPWVDMVLRGEAENSIIPLVTCLQSGGNLASVPGLTWRSRNQVIRNPDAPIVADLDTLPTPAYHLLPIERLVQYYKGKVGLYHSNFLLEAGRGCPFNCSFCSTSTFFQRRYRAKSVDRLVGEIIDLHTHYGLEHFDLSHDLFTCNRAYALEFCHSLRDKGLHKRLKWGCYSRTDTVDHEILAEMAAAGCSSIFFGIETGSQRMQKVIGKNLPIKQVKSVVKETLSLGMNVSTAFICGFPQERQEDLSATFASIMDMLHMGVDQIGLFPLIPLLSSELYQTFGDTLRYDGPWSSDISYGRLSQQDQEQILKWPDIFAGFYHYETPGLNYHILRALLRVVNRYPRLLAALSARNIDVMSVLGDWPEWYRNNAAPATEDYYFEKGFFLDFLRFLREDLNSNAVLTPHLNDVINFHTVIERVADSPEDEPIDSERFTCDVPALMSHVVEGKPLSEEALQPATYLFWKTSGKVISKRLTSTLAGLLGITQS